ncbi:hypothetical protein ACM25O_13100 [Sulfitobacter pontiacus]
MKLRAIHAIIRKDEKKKTPVRVEPGKPFECPEDEGNGYIASGAAARIVEEAPAASETPKKAAAAKKPATKPAAPATPAPAAADNTNNDPLS